LRLKPKNSSTITDHNLLSNKKRFVNITLKNTTVTFVNVWVYHKQQLFFFVSIPK